MISQLTGFESDTVKAIHRWSGKTVSLALLLIASFAIFVAIRKDHLPFKIALLAWLVLP